MSISKKCFSCGSSELKFVCDVCFDSQYCSIECKRSSQENHNCKRQNPNDVLSCTLTKAKSQIKEDLQIELIANVIKSTQDNHNQKQNQTECINSLSFVINSIENHIEKLNTDTSVSKSVDKIKEEDKEEDLESIKSDNENEDKVNTSNISGNTQNDSFEENSPSPKKDLSSQTGDFEVTDQRSLTEWYKVALVLQAESLQHNNSMESLAMAKEMQEKAEQVIGELSPLMLNVQVGLGNIYKLDDDDRCITQFKRALEVAEKNNDLDSVVAIYAKLLKEYRDQGDVRNAAMMETLYTLARSKKVICD